MKRCRPCLSIAAAGAVLLSAIVTACSGSGADVGMGGTGGTPTPVVSNGSISGFGSVWVNGVRYDDTAAAIRIEDAPALRSELRLGMYARISGKTANSTATADKIETRVVAQGKIAALNVNGFTLLANIITVDAQTVWEGAGSLAQLSVNDYVKVWGYARDKSAREWIATRLERAPAADAVVTAGTVESVGSAQFTVAGITVATAAAVFDGVLNPPAVGSRVRVAGTQSASAAVNATRVSKADSDQMLPSTGRLEIEGQVSEVSGGGEFIISGTRMNAANARIVGGTLANLTVGVNVEAKGEIVNGRFVAQTIEIEDRDVPENVEIEGRIEQFSAPGLFTVRGQAVDARMATLKPSNASLNDLTVGRKVNIKGSVSGNTVFATEVEVQL